MMVIRWQETAAAVAAQFKLVMSVQENLLNALKSPPLHPDVGTGFMNQFLISNATMETRKAALIVLFRLDGSARTKSDLLRCVLSK